MRCVPVLMVSIDIMQTPDRCFTLVLRWLQLTADVYLGHHHHVISVTVRLRFADVNLKIPGR